MNIKEIAEIKRRFRAEKSNIGRIRGCLINEKKEIVSYFDQSLALMSLEESEEILALLRKTLSGAPGRNLIDLSFTNAQVLDSEEHRLLSTLRTSALADDKAVNTLIDRIRESHQSEGNYVILLATDSYDVPSYGADGHKKDDSSHVYTYILCAICPIKMTKSALGYRITENSLRNVTPDWLVSSPEAGFLFPAFDGRTANIYNTLFYTKDVADNHEAMIEALFRCEAPMPAAEQKESFRTLIHEALAEECDLEIVKTVQEQFSDLIEEHKASKDPDPLMVTQATVSDVLRSCGVEDEHVERFAERFDAAFGAKAEMPPENIMSTRQLEVKTPEVSIRLSAEMSDMVETRILDGQKYILIRADGLVEVNGVEIIIREDK
ncbi:MAG: DUF4317 domain-containing protein [Ruminococcaceae bacterium]|nr:DUF4317 domain-containing protein [Oscillospiraceae bacterium]